MKVKLVSKVIIAKVLEVILLIESYFLLVAVSGILTHFLELIMIHLFGESFLSKPIILYSLSSIESIYNILTFVALFCLFLVALIVNLFAYIWSFEIVRILFSIIGMGAVAFLSIILGFDLIKGWINWNIRNFKE